MIVTMKFPRMNKELLKKFIDIRPVMNALNRRYSQNHEEFFKMYSEDCVINGYGGPLTADDYTRFFSKRSMRREPALTREMTNLSYKVGKHVISLAEGMPNEGVFPISKVDIEVKGTGRLLLEGSDLSAALQYIPSQGLPPLLSELRQFQNDVHRPPAVPRDVIVTNGGQHGIYQCMDLLMEEGDPVVLNEYTYTGAHVALKPYNPEIISIPEDQYGMIPETLESILSARLSRGLKMPKLLYIIPTGSNPTGTVVPEERRRKIYELACRFDFLIIEDDPYVFCNYSEKRVPTFLSLDTCGRVIRLDSLSKVVSAGLRAGWVTAPTPVLQKLELHMQSELLHSCTLSQVILHHLISNREALASHLKAARDLYRQRRDALSDALQGLTGLADWTLPDAGLFFWLKVRGVEDVHNMVFRTALKRGLMVVPGQAFSYYTNAPCQYIRLTFSRIRYENMNTATRHLADIIKEEQQLYLQKLPQRLATER
ncbi:unnamed protein product [Diatraea saccharalis]|uniref:Aminotransferase class I/classII large domain-containing protein n=1 Tax=Diatraea saccharalis TaxID=40085 RepID=A0A9N9WGX1_9NEOP|nr:unnamed protein product [Diatraea saccharalis]